MERKGARERIIGTFTDMVEEMPLEQIRIQDLIVRSGVSKSTFYRYFQDKYDVMDQVYQSATDSLVQELPALTNWKTWSYQFFAHIRQHKKFYRSLISYKGQNSLQESMALYFSRNSKTDIYQKLGCDKLTEELDFAVEAFNYVCAFANIKWICEGCVWPDDVLLGYIEQCIPDCLRPFYK